MNLRNCVGLQVKDLCNIKSLMLTTCIIIKRFKLQIISVDVYARMGLGMTSDSFSQLEKLINYKQLKKNLVFISVIATVRKAKT